MLSHIRPYLNHRGIRYRALNVTAWMIAGLLAMLSYHYRYVFDWSDPRHAQLSNLSVQLLQNLDRDIEFKFYSANNTPIATAVKRLIALYRDVKPSIMLRMIPDNLQNDDARRWQLGDKPVLIVLYAGREKKLTVFNESSISNALQQLARNRGSWLLFLQGHGERRIHGIANHDYGNWGKQLKQRGFKFIEHTLSQNAFIPDNTSGVVIADPRLDYLPGEIALLRDYIAQGGNILCFLQDGDTPRLRAFWQEFGVRARNAPLQDANALQLGIQDTHNVLVSDYANHPLTQSLQGLSLFPGAHALTYEENQLWTIQPLLRTSTRSYLEHAGSRQPGPYNLALSLQRKNNNSSTKKGARLLVIGNADFLSNTYLGNGVNLDLGLRISNWLTQEDQLLNIPAHSEDNLQLHLSITHQAIIGFGFLIILPMLFTVSGVLIARRRKSRA